MEEKVFAKGYCLAKIFLFFLIGCVVGTYYEEVLNFIKTGTYSDRQGLLYGPFSPIYGIGVAVFVIVLGKHNEQRSVLKTLCYASLVGGFTEFITSWVADVFFDVEFWDYTGYFLNIMGRTTIPFMIGWGIGGTLLMKVIYPFLSKFIERFPYRYAQPVYRIVLVFILADILLTYSAFGRMALRDQGKSPYTWYGEFLDDVYPDDYMYHKFPIMVPEK